MTKRCIAALLLTAVAFPVHAEIAFRPTWEIGAGYADELDGEGTGSLLVSHLRDVEWLERFKMRMETSVGWIGSRSDLADPRADEDVLFVSMGVRRHWTRHIYTGSALVLVSHQSEALSSFWQFKSAIGWQNERINIGLWHLSNASITGRNRGETVLSFSLRFD